MIIYTDPVMVVKPRYLGAKYDLHLRLCPARGCDYRQGTCIRPGIDAVNYSPCSHLCVDGMNHRWDAYVTTKAYLKALDKQLDY